jgi:serine/threonine protein kinase
MASHTGDGSIGETIADRYRIIKELGRGGLGIVYKALDMRLQRVVALKVIHSGPNTESRRRLTAEARIASRLKHPNLVQTYDHGVADGVAYTVGAYVEGSTLQELMARGSVDSHRAIEIIQQVGRGLEYLHQQGLVHRDVKPGNILISNEGAVLLTDFGLTVPSGTTTLMETYIAGTPNYLSPEQARGSTVAPSSDVFLLGIILYELLTGRHPFRASSSIETLQNIVESAPIPPRHLNPALPEPLDKVVLKALAKVPENRFRSCTEFLTALDHAKEGIGPRLLGSDGPPDLESLSRIQTALLSTTEEKVARAVTRGTTAKAIPTAAKVQLPPPQRVSGLAWLGTNIPVMLVAAVIYVWAALAISSWAGTPAAVWITLAVGLIVAWSGALRMRNAIHTGHRPVTASPSPTVANSSPVESSNSAPLEPGNSSSVDVQDVTQTALQPYSPKGQQQVSVSYRYGLASLYEFDTTGLGHEFKLSRSCAIGRSPDNDLVVQNQTVSRRHARIDLENDRFWITDLSTTHGTFVNDKRIARCELHDGDEITIGRDKTLLFVQAVSPTLHIEGRRRLKEFDTIWESLISAARDE